INFRNGPRAPEERLRETGPADIGDLAVEILLHAAVALEIRGDEFRGLLRVDSQLLGEAKGGKSVNHAEIDYFCDPAMLGRLRERRDAENFLRRARMNIFAAAEGFHKNRIPGDMGENTQFDL